MSAAFLRMNGFRLEFSDLEAYEFILGLYETGSLRFVELEKWLRAHARA